VSLAEHLNGNGHSAKAVAGQTSQFDVIADGKLVFSKQREGRFPEEDEIIAQL
jgi:predicted Rdx family selenoprotein